MGNRVLFPAQNTSYTVDKPGICENLVWISDPNGTRFPCLWLYKSYPITLIYFHGNSVDLGDVLDEMWCIQDYVNCNILAIEYPGYGVCGDIPADSKVIDSWGMAAYSWLVSISITPKSILMFGRSIGTGPAAYLAARLKQKFIQIGGLILHCPYISIHKIVSDYAPFATWLIDNCWDIEKCLKVLEPNTPILIIHGENDIIIPVYHGKQLYNNYNADKFVKDAWFPLDSPHNAYMIYEDLAIPIKQFLDKKVDLKKLHSIRPTINPTDRKVPLSYSKWRSGAVAQSSFRDNLVQKAPLPKDKKT